jgi:3-isopropylmalate/(R)-2-methylmalate dehydratase small subunit
MTFPEMISGRVWTLGDHVNTDVLHPSSYFSLNETRVKEGLLEGMERLGGNVNWDVSHEGLVIVAGENFGCGSSRETSARGLQNFGVRGVVAVTFARIFFRSFTNLGIPTFECGEIHRWARDGDVVHIFVKEGFVELANAKRFPFTPIDPHIRKILEAGGLIPYLRREKDGI